MTLSTEQFWEAMCDSRFIRTGLREGMIDGQLIVTGKAPEEIDGFVESKVESIITNLDLKEFT